MELHYTEHLTDPHWQAELWRLLSAHDNDFVPPLSQREDPPGQYPLLPPGLAQRPAAGGKDRPADRGPGYRPLSPEIRRPDGGGSPMAGPHLG